MLTPQEQLPLHHPTHYRPAGHRSPNKGSWWTRGSYYCGACDSSEDIPVWVARASIRSGSGCLLSSNEGYEVDIDACDFLVYVRPRVWYSHGVCRWSRGRM
jgi:hypothetical protein